MKNSFSVVYLALIGLIASCKSDSVSPLPQPKANFSLDGTDATSLTIGTHDEFYPVNMSTNATSLVWDFGNGVTSTDEHPKVSYETMGSYELTLTASGQGGSKNVMKKTVVVKDRILKTVELHNIHLNSYQALQAAGVTFPVFTKLDLWVELKFSQGPLQRSSNFDVIAPTIFKTPVFAQVDSSFHSSLGIHNLPQTQNVIINYPVSDSYFYQGGIGLVADLYGTDGTTTYLLYSSSWSGCGFGFAGSTNPAISNTYAAVTTPVTVTCQFQ